MLHSLQWHVDNFLHSPKFFLLPLTICISFASSVLLISICLPILRKYKIVDNPDARRAHKLPTVRGGGIALVIAFIFTMLVITFISDENLVITPLIISIILLGTISFLDDAYQVPIPIRLTIHFISATICVIYYTGGYSLFRGELPQAIDISLSIIGLVFFLNIFNFLDGIDGISTCQSIHLATTAILLCIIRDKVIIGVDIVFYSSAIILGCSIAFLLFNWNPAAIFLGDVGSTFFGIIHGLNLLLIASSSDRLFLASVIVSFYYIADGGITILIRAYKGEKIWLPHLNHFFQQAARKGMSHKEIVIKIASCNVILLICAVVSIYVPHIALLISFLSISFLLIHFQE